MPIRPGKILTSLAIDCAKANIHRVLENYYGLAVKHFRRSQDERDVYYGNTANDWVELGDGKHLIRLSSNDFDTLWNDSVVFEDVIPIEILLDPTTDWKEHDHIVIEIDTEGSVWVQRFELVRIRSSTKSGLTFYKMASIAPERAEGWQVDPA